LIFQTNRVFLPIPKIIKFLCRESKRIFIHGFNLGEISGERAIEIAGSFGKAFEAQITESETCGVNPPYIYRFVRLCAKFGKTV
jgi:hypothetical protein